MHDLQELTVIFEIEGENRTAGPPVLIEASADETLVPLPDDRAWSTRLFDTDKILAGIAQAATSAAATSVAPLVGDESIVISLCKSERNNAPHICIGRAKRSDVLLQDDTVSSLHAVFEDGERPTLSDRDSSNGTFVNRRRLMGSEQAALKSGDCVRLGKRVFYFLTGEDLNELLRLRNL